VRSTTTQRRLIGCRISDGHLFVIGIWEKPEGQAGVGWEVDRQLVEDVLEDAFDRYDVRLMWPDPWGDWRSVRGPLGG
jgi:hypothetical protein